MRKRFPEVTRQSLNPGGRAETYDRNDQLRPLAKLECVHLMESMKKIMMMSSIMEPTAVQLRSRVVTFLSLNQIARVRCRRMTSESYPSDPGFRHGYETHIRSAITIPTLMSPTQNFQRSASASRREILLPTSAALVIERTRLRRHAFSEVACLHD